jgi:hypothetical protein
MAINKASTIKKSIKKEKSARKAYGSGGYGSTIKSSGSSRIVEYTLVIYRHEDNIKILVNHNEHKRNVYTTICKADKEEKALKAIYNEYKKSKCSTPIEYTSPVELPKIDRPKSVLQRVDSTDLSATINKVSTKDTKKDILQRFFALLDEELPKNNYKIISNTSARMSLVLGEDSRIADGEHLIVLHFEDSVYSYRHAGKNIVSSSKVEHIFI